MSEARLKYPESCFSYNIIAAQKDICYEKCRRYKRHCGTANILRDTDKRSTTKNAGEIKSLLRIKMIKEHGMTEN